MKKFLLIIVLLILQIASYSQKDDIVSNDSDKIVMSKDFNKLDLRVFPNPTKIQKVTLEMPTDEIAEIQLLNIIGKEVLKKQLEPGTHQYELNLRGIPQGVYLVQVKTYENKAVVKKLLISEN